MDTIELPVMKKDPVGLIRRDLEMLRRAFPNERVEPGQTNDEIMYRAGQQAVLKYIEEKLIAYD